MLLPRKVPVVRVAHSRDQTWQAVPTHRVSSLANQGGAETIFSGKVFPPCRPDRLSLTKDIDYGASRLNGHVVVGESKNFARAASIPALRAYDLPCRGSNR